MNIPCHISVCSCQQSSAYLQCTFQTEDDYGFPCCVLGVGSIVKLCMMLYQILNKKVLTGVQLACSSWGLRGGKRLVVAWDGPFDWATIGAELVGVASVPTEQRAVAESGPHFVVAGMCHWQWWWGRSKVLMSKVDDKGWRSEPCNSDNKAWLFQPYLLLISGTLWHGGNRG